MPAAQAAPSQPVSADVWTLQSFEIEDHWFWIERFLRRIDNPPWTLLDVKLDLKAAQAQAWCLGDGRNTPVGLVITRIENYHGTRFGLLWIAVGEGIEHSRKMIDEIERWFKSMGCTRSEIAGRKGWEKVLTDYELKAVVLVKELV